MSPHQIAREKVEQAVEILREKNVDAWLTFVRETPLTRDPSLSLIVSPDLQLTWHSAFILSQRGDRIAIVGRFDKENIEAIGAYTEVQMYDAGIGQALVTTLLRLNPDSIAVNFSESDPAADGLTHGLWLTLLQALNDAPFAGRLISAEKIVNALRGRKTPTEIARITDAVADTEAIFDEVTTFLEPGQTEIEIAEFIHDRMKSRGLTTAWDIDYCPTLTAGPNSPVGHAAPGNSRTARGHLLQIDFGVNKNGYVSDMQRTWYFLAPGEAKPPADAQQAFEAVRGAILAGADSLYTGAPGWKVDMAARDYLMEAGYPEYMHATGHHIGQTVHDGATVLGPRWERYGQSVYGEVEADNVFTLELGAAVPGRGYVGLEEDLLVTPGAVEWLSHPQTELICV